MITTKADAKMNYEKACHLGKKEGGSPAVLDAILQERHITAPAEVSLGLVSIPVERIVGTKSKGRSQSFQQELLSCPEREYRVCFQMDLSVQRPSQ